MAGSRQAKRMSAEAARAEACARLRKAGATDNERAREYFGHAAAGWRMQWTDGSAAIFEPDSKAATRPQLPERWAEVMAAEPPALQWQPYREIARAVHVVAAVARGLKCQHVTIRPEPFDHARDDSGRVVLHYADAAHMHTARTWGDAAVYAPTVRTMTIEERARVLDAHTATVALRYLAPLLWADETGWVVRRVQLGGLPLVMFHAPEVRAVVAEIQTDETPATPADEDGATC